MTRSEQQKLAWAALSIPRDTPQRLRVIESLLKIPEQRLAEVNAKQ